MLLISLLLVAGGTPEFKSQNVHIKDKVAREIYHLAAPNPRVLQREQKPRGTATGDYWTANKIFAIIFSSLGSHFWVRGISPKVCCRAH